MRKVFHRRSKSADYRRISSSDESALSLNGYTVTPTESPSHPITPNKVIDLDEVVKQSIDYQRKLSESPGHRPTICKISEFPESNLTMDQHGTTVTVNSSSEAIHLHDQPDNDDNLITWSEILKQDCPIMRRKRKRSLPKLPDSSNKLLDKYTVKQNRFSKT